MSYYRKWWWWRSEKDMGIDLGGEDKVVCIDKTSIWQPDGWKFSFCIILVISTDVQSEKRGSDICTNGTIKWCNYRTKSFTLHLNFFHTVLQEFLDLVTAEYKKSFNLQICIWVLWNKIRNIHNFCFLTVLFCKETKAILFDDKKCSSTVSLSSWCCHRKLLELKKKLQG